MTVQDDQTEHFCGMGYSVPFLFTDQSIDTLINVISSLPKNEDPKPEAKKEEPKKEQPKEKK